MLCADAYQTAQAPSSKRKYLPLLIIRPKLQTLNANENKKTYNCAILDLHGIYHKVPADLQWILYSLSSGHLRSPGQLLPEQM